MLANFLIGLREGLEAALVVSILVAYLVASGRRDRLRAVWGGVSAAVVLSLGLGAALTFTSANLGERSQELFGGFMSLLAVGFVTWMIFWMRRTARSIASDLRDRTDRAVAMGAGALALTAFVAVAREGLETALFLWTAAQAAGSGPQPILGAVLGLGLAVLLGWLLYRRAVRINLATFFKVTGAALVVIAAGVLVYGIHELQEGGLLPGEDALAFDVSPTIAATSVLGTVLRGVLNIRPAMSWFEVAAWLAYVVPVMTLFLRPQRRAAPHAVTQRPVADTRTDTDGDTDADAAERDHRSPVVTPPGARPPGA